MKQLLLLCALLLAATGGQAQNLNDVPLEDRDSTWYAKRDSLKELDQDTGEGNILHLNIVGDVISGYDFTVEPAYPDSIVWDDTTCLNGNPDIPIISHHNEENKHSKAFRWYHTGPNGRKVRQIVVLRSRWPNLPDDLKNHTETYGTGGNVIFSVEAGYRLAALTPKEYAECRKLDLIWGEIFEAAWADGTDTIPEDERSKVPGMEIVCYTEDSIPLWKASAYGPEQRKLSREIMSYTDPATGKDYMCAAPNHTTSRADYTRAGSGGKYETRWLLASEEESQSWWQRTIDYLNSLKAVQAFMRWWKEV